MGVISELRQHAEPAKDLYPGTDRPIADQANQPDPEPDPDRWDARPRVLMVGGVSREFFTVGQLARALMRKPVTIRKWEREKVVPAATFRLPSEDPRGVRRLYSREQVEGLALIATQEGLMQGDFRPIRETDFTRRAYALFRRLAEESARS